MKRGARPFTKGPFPADLRARFAHIRAGAAPGAPSAPSTAATPSRAASDLEPCDWKAKFDAIKVDPETKTPLWGEISRVAMLPPEVPKETLRRRYETRDVSSTKMGPKPALGVLEDDLLEWLRAYKSMGVHIYTKIVCEKARRLAKAAGLEWDFIASRRWLEGFCTRHKLNLRQGQFLERERAHAVSRESLGRYFDILEEASVGVKPGGIWMLDEVHVNLLDTGGYTVISFGKGDYPSIPKPETSKHITFLGCVNAEGKDSTPALVFQGVRAMSRYSREYPEALLGMDEAGYMSCELFLTWCATWEKSTRPADGAPRLLLFDGHFSHMAIDGVVFLRKHNVRVVTVHPHTTHLTCVLDNGPFRRFNYFLSDEVARLSPPGTAVSDSNVAGCVRRAWLRMLEITPHPVTNEPSNPAISAFKKTGIHPFSRHLLKTDIFAASDTYKLEADATGKGGGPSAKRPALTLTDKDREELKKSVLTMERELPPDISARIAASTRVRMAEFLTSDAWLKAELDRKQVAQDVEAAKAAKRGAKEALRAARGGLSKADWDKAQRAAAKAVADAAKAEAANAPAAAPAAAPAPKAAAPKKAAAKPQPKVGGGDPYAKPYGAPRGAKRARADD